MRHPFDPVYESRSKVLILGSFPSVKSRQNGFYYGHPQNRFWKVISALCDETIPVTNEEKKAVLLNHKLALWDVLESCEIIGSSDVSIKDAIHNDIAALIQHTDIKVICVNGKIAFNLLRQIDLDLSMITLIQLPSTSAANAALTLEELIKRWGDEIKPWLE